MEQFKEMQRAVWNSGDYASLTAPIAGVGQLVVDRLDLEPGMRLLDVACGTGNAALPAARAGADVTGLDLASVLLDGGRAAAAAEGLEVEWVEGDAEDLPFEDGAFDRVVSTFGHMFAPRHRRTAEEMARVCATGGVIAFACWTPDGTVGQLFKAAAAYQPAPPDFASPPALWGTEGHVREMFDGVARSFEFELHSAPIIWDSFDGWADRFLDGFPPMVMAQKNLGERFEEMRAKVIDIWREHNEAHNGGIRVPQEYLLSVVRL